MWYFLASALLVVMAGCTTPGTMKPKACQEKALQLVWHQLYGRTDAPPEVEWHSGERLWSDGPRGITLEGWKIVLVDDVAPDVVDARLDKTCFWFSVTPFAHELMHERTFRATGDVDVFHVHGDWGLVDRADGALSDAHM